MMANFDFKLTGFEEATKKLRELSPKLQKKSLRAAARKAMNIARDDARQNAPVSTRLTKRSITTQVRSTRNAVISKVGIRGGARKRGNNPYWWRFIELGFYSKKANRFIKANPFMRNALSKNTDKVTDVMAQELKIAIEKEV